MNDFADWFSPIIVKELRQGMRARAFIGIFLAIQLFMIVCVLVSLGNDSSSTRSVTTLFWMVVGGAIILAMPMRGMAALNGEMKGNTLELMLLTQLSAWRVTAGKWLALMCQTLLLVCAILPYVVVRYFLGGINLVEDLIILGWMLAASSLLTALTVGCSPFMESMVARIGLGFGIFFGLYITLVMTFMRMHGGSGTTSPALSTWVWAAALLGPLLILELFELGVGKIAPAAENHGTRKRLIAVVLVTTAILLGRHLHESGLMSVLAVLAITPILMGVLIEETVTVPSLYRPFVRRKFFGRLAGRLLYPGWASGLLFFAIIAAVILWSAPLAWHNSDVHFPLLAGVEAIFLPLALVRLCFRRAKSILPFYFSLQVILFVTTLILSANCRNNHTVQTFGSYVPTMGFFLNLWGNNRGANLAYVNGIAVIDALSLLVLLILSIKEWKLISAMERQATALE